MPRGLAKPDGDEPTCAQRQLTALEELTRIARFGSRLGLVALILIALLLWRSEARFDAAERSRIKNASNTTVLGARHETLDARVRTLEEWKYVYQQRDHNRVMERVDKARKAKAAETP